VNPTKEEPLNWTFFALAPTGQDGASPLSMLFPIIGMLLIFYFLLIRPQQKRQKETQKMIAALKNGDRVLTSSGIYGHVAAIKDDIVILKIADNVKVEVLKSAVSAVIEKGK
jgi:preprotein translocase subunit YajC